MRWDEGNDAVCRCGHERAAHEHYRAGTECSICPDCSRFRPPSRTWRVVASMLRRPRR